LLINFYQAGIPLSGIDDPRNAPGLLENFVEHLIGEQRIGSASDGEVMGDMGLGFGFI